MVLVVGRKSGRTTGTSLGTNDWFLATVFLGKERMCDEQRQAKVSGRD